MNQEKTMARAILSLGIELGSTRIKSVLIDEHQEVVASGVFQWENQLDNGVWTYGVDLIWEGLQASYAQLRGDYEKQTGKTLDKIDYIGISAMMHGYLAFDKTEDLLVPFRTWRNAMTAAAEKELTKLFEFNIPQRWSIAHLYQSLLNHEPHTKNIDFFTTLAGYVHWKLTGEKVLGIGDASGMFPIDPATKDYHPGMLQKFEEHIAPYANPWEIKTILPTVLSAGEQAGTLTKAGAKLLDPTGELKHGSCFCPPEGDAGTGMVATNSIRPRTGNISAGTSVFAMIVLDHPLSRVYPQIDQVTTPVGDQVAMVHANNCSSDLNAWVGIFKDFLNASGIEMSQDRLFEILFQAADKGEADVGGLLSYGYLSGENITQMPKGRPLLVRTPESNFNLNNLMRTHLYSAFGALHLGMKILTEKESVSIDKIFGHGGMFKTAGVAQKILAAAINTPVSIMETAGEGGAWGIALLADYLNHSDQLSLEDYLEKIVFRQSHAVEYSPAKEEVAGYDQFGKRYEAGLEIERAAIQNLGGI